MKHTNILLSFVLVFAFAMGTFSVSAIETDAELESRIEALRNTHAELKAEVEAGTLSTEEAREQWQSLLDEARGEKEDFFEKKRAQIEARYEMLLENNPERAEFFKEHMEAMRDRHKARVEKRAELRAQVESGDLSRQEANRMRVEFFKNQQKDFQELKVKAKERLRYSIDEGAARIENPNAERRAGYLEIEGVKGEARARERGNSAQTGNAIRIEASSDGSVKPVRVDPFGINALEVFGEVRADLEQATADYDSQREDITTDTQ